MVRLNLYCVDKQPTDRAVAKCLWHGLSSARQKGSIPFCEDALHSSPSHASHDLFFSHLIHCPVASECFRVMTVPKESLSDPSCTAAAEGRSRSDSFPGALEAWKQ